MRYQKIILVFLFLLLALFVVPNIIGAFADRCGFGLSRTAFKLLMPLERISLIQLRSIECPDDRKVNNVVRLQLILELYKDNHGVYPENLAEIISSYRGTLTRDFNPSDYKYQKNGGIYQLSVQLEHRDNPRLKNDLDPTNTIYEVQPYIIN